MAHLTVETAHALIAGTLPPNEVAAWQAHVRTCNTCRELLAGEEALTRVLDLGDNAPAPATTDPERLARRMERLAPDANRRIRRRLTWTVVEAAVAVALTGLLVWQFVRAARAPSDVARDLGISTDLQQRVIANLDALDVLTTDAWLVEDYETVRTLEQFIFEDGPE
jgi:hypothetical protein